MKNRFKLFTISVFCFFSLLISAQETINKSSIEVHEMNGFRFELHHQSKACPECVGCICKDILVYDSKGKLIHEQKIEGNNQIHSRMVDKMDVYDFNFDGFPDFRLVDFDVYYDTYYIYQATSENYLIDPYLSQCTNLHFYQNEKEAIGFYLASLPIESKNIKIGPNLNTHRFHFKGKNLEQLTIESKVWFNPWNGPLFYEDTISPKYLHTRTCTYKNFILEQIGDEKVTIGLFTPLPLSNDSINLKIRDEYYFQYIQPKITYKEEKKSNYSLFKDRAKDTIIEGKKYAWVVYDLNKNPFEIGEDYTNGIKNGEWITRDQQGRISSIVNYLNDTLIGYASYFYYENYPWNVTKISGFVINGYKVGEWKYFHNNKFKSINDKNWYLARTDNFDRTGKLLSFSMPANEKVNAYTMFLDESGKVIWTVFYDNKGRIIRETNENPIEKQLENL